MHSYFTKVINIEGAAEQEEREAQIEADAEERKLAGFLPERKREIQLSKKGRGDIF